MSEGSKQVFPPHSTVSLLYCYCFRSLVVGYTTTTVQRTVFCIYMIHDTYRSDHCVVLFYVRYFIPSLHLECFLFVNIVMIAISPWTRLMKFVCVRRRSLYRYIFLSKMKFISYMNSLNYFSYMSEYPFFFSFFVTAKLKINMFCRYVCVWKLGGTYSCTCISVLVQLDLTRHVCKTHIPSMVQNWKGLYTHIIYLIILSSIQNIEQTISSYVKSGLTMWPKNQ